MDGTTIVSSSIITRTNLQKGNLRRHNAIDPVKALVCEITLGKKKVNGGEGGSIIKDGNHYVSFADPWCSLS